MKLFITLTALLATATLATSQNQITQQPQPVSVLSEAGTVSTVESQRQMANPPTTTGTTVIWEEDFANGIPTSWLVTDNSGICPWKYSHNGSFGFYSGNFPNCGDTIASTTQGNGFMICDIDSANHYTYGQPAVVTYQYLDTYIRTEAIDLTGFPVAYLEFLQFFRYGNGIDVFVSVSNDGFSWTDFDVKHGVINNSYSQNPDTVRLDISAVAGNQPTVYVRWGWNARFYFWMVDDVRIISAPDNDLVIDQDYYNGVADPSQVLYYTNIPQRQAQAEQVLYGCKLTNKGSLVGPNVKLDVTVTGADYWTGNSFPFNMNILEQDSMNINGNYTPFNLGTNNVDFTVSSDSIDENPLDNTIVTSFNTTDTIYSRDYDNHAGQGWWYGSGIAWTCATMYEIHTQDTASSISILFQSSSSTGAQIQIQLYDEFYNLVTSTSTISMTSQMKGNWWTFKIPDAPLPPGKYLPAFRALSGNVLIGADQNPPLTPPDLVFTDVYNNNFWNMIQDFSPLIRLNTKAGMCAGYQVDLDLVPTSCGNVNGAATCNITGGQSPYIYLWDSNAGNATTQGVTGLSTGIYWVTITDSQGCSSVKAAIITDAGYPQIAFSDTGLVCAADCFGSAIAFVTGAISPYTYEWSSGDTTQVIDTMCAGTYIVTVTDIYGCTDVDSVVITAPPPFVIGISTTDDAGNGNGSATVTPSGSNPPYTYQWDSLAGYQTDSTATNLTGGQTQGNYMVTITDSLGCDTVITVNVGATGVSDYNLEHMLEVYPNPSNGRFIIVFKHALQGRYRLSIHNLLGQAIFNDELNIGRKEVRKLTMHLIDKGVYFLNVETERGKAVKKIVIQ